MTPHQKAHARYQAHLDLFTAETAEEIKAALKELSSLSDCTSVTNDSAYMLGYLAQAMASNNHDRKALKRKLEASDAAVNCALVFGKQLAYGQ